ncbi:MAG TPA: hypothetical protein VGH81_12940 [Rudaea sp.]|jgi:hypothetical protein
MIVDALERKAQRLAFSPRRHFACDEFLGFAERDQRQRTGVAHHGRIRTDREDGRRVRWLQGTQQ